MFTSLGFPASCRLCLNPTDELPNEDIPCEQIHPESGRTIHDLLLEMCFDRPVDEPSSSEGSICQACYGELENAYRFRSQCTEMNKFYKALVEAKITGSEEPVVELIEQKSSDKLRSQLERLGIISSDNLFMQSQAASLISKNEIETDIDMSTTMDDTEPPGNTIRQKTNVDLEDFSRPNAYNPKAIGYKNVKICPVPDCRDPIQDNLYGVHLRDCHKYGCKLCGLILNGRSLMAQHVVIHKNLPLTVQCTFCNQKFPSFATMRSHVKAIHKKLTTSFTCKECKVLFNSSKSFAEHIDSHLPKECTDCLDHFKDHTKLLRHNKIHHPEKVFTCGHCFQKFLTQYTLDHHMEQSAGNSNHLSDETFEVLTIKSMATFNCLECNKQYSSEAHFSTHMNKHESQKVPKPKRPKQEIDDEEYRFHCDQCNAKYLQQSTLHRHQKKHEVQEQAVCDVCGAVFKQKSYLKNHMIYKHTKDYRQVCEFCQKSFATSSDLIRHRRIHTKQFLYQCNQCGDRFTSKSSLKWHMRANANREVHRSTYNHDRKRKTCDDSTTAQAQGEPVHV